MTLKFYPITSMLNFRILLDYSDLTSRRVLFERSDLEDVGLFDRGDFETLRISKIYKILGTQLYYVSRGCKII